MLDIKGIADSLSDKGAPGPGPEIPEASPMSDEDLMAEDVLAAFAENDPKALVSSLKALFASFEGKPHTEAESDEK